MLALCMLLEVERDGGKSGGAICAHAAFILALTPWLCRYTWRLTSHTALPVGPFPFCRRVPGGPFQGAPFRYLNFRWKVTTGREWWRLAEARMGRRWQRVGKTAAYPAQLQARCPTPSRSRRSRSTRAPARRKATQWARALSPSSGRKRTRQPRYCPSAMSLRKVAMAAQSLAAFRSLRRKGKDSCRLCGVAHAFRLAALQGEASARWS